MAKAKQYGMSEKESKPWGSGQFANMPQEAKMASYPKAHQEGPTVENDTMTRLDAEGQRSQKQSRKNMSYQH